MASRFLNNENKYTSSRLFFFHGFGLFSNVAPTGGGSEYDANLQVLADQLLDNSCPMHALEDVLITRALERTDQNVTQAAKLLGLSRATLDYRLKKTNG